MNLHLLRPIVTRDLRNQRWLLLAWIVVLIANVATRVIGSQLPIETIGRDDLTTMVLTAQIVAFLLVAFIGVALIVQTDLVVGTTAFWLTRPISRGTMLGGKLLSIVLILMLPALAIEATLMAAYGVAPLPLALALLQQAWVMTPFILLIALGAAVTRTLVQMFVLAIIAFVTLILWDRIWTYIWGASQAGPVVPPPRSYDPSGGIIAGTLFTCGVLAALAFQYWRRHAALAVLIAAASLVAVTGGPRGFWSHISLFGGEPKPPQEAWTTRPLVLQSGAPLTWATLRPAARLLANFIDQAKIISAPLTIEGLPSNYTAQPVLTDATLRFANGTVVPSFSHGFYPQVDENGWPVIVDARNDRLRAAGDGPASYHAQFDIGLIRHERLATVPLTPGAGYNDGARRLIVASIRPLGGPVPRCAVRLDETTVQLFTQRRRSPRLEVHARLADGTPMRTAAFEGSMAFGFGRPLEPLPQGFHPFQIGFRSVDVTAPRCDGLLLDIERVSYAGRLFRTIDLPEVNVNEVTTMESR